MTMAIGETALALAETRLAGCIGCGMDCNTCPEIDGVLDSLMIIRAYDRQTEIDVTEDKYDADRLAG